MEPVRAVCGFLRPLIHFLAVCTLASPSLSMRYGANFGPPWSAAAWSSEKPFEREGSMKRSSDRAAPTRIMNNIGCGDIFHHRETLITGAIIARKRGPQPNGGAMDVLQHCVDLGNQHKTAAPNRLFNCMCDAEYGKIYAIYAFASCAPLVFVRLVWSWFEVRKARRVHGRPVQYLGARRSTGQREQCAGVEMCRSVVEVAAFGNGPCLLTLATLLRRRTRSPAST
ncbi:unnamed protein product, partial [Cladocopium goreaui]